MRGAFALIFAASGAAALVYEVTWTRLLTLQLGHGVAAASTVLAAFMGGLAAGSALAGGLGNRLGPRAALRTYGALELVIAALAVILPFELDAVAPLLANAYADGAAGSSFAVLRLGISLLMLAIPAAAMGATFPIASRWFVPHASRAATDAGTLYSANTVGAALGALLAGFVLLPWLGLNGATWVGVALNAVAAAGAWTIAARAAQVAPADGGAEAPPLREAGAASAPRDAAVAAPAPRSGASAGPSERSESMAAPPAAGAQRQRRAKRKPAQAAQPPAPTVPIVARPKVAALALGISGFASLTDQIIWTRLLASILGPTTYAFSIIVAVFIAGIAGGAAIGGWLAARWKNPLVGLSLCLTAAAGLGLVAAGSVEWALMTIARLVANPQTQFSDVVWQQATLVAALLLPMTLAFGAAFPFAVALAVASEHDEDIVPDIGLIYAVNTVGAILGALSAGFLLIPRFGLHDTIRLVSAIGAFGAIGLIVVNRSRRPAALAAALIAAVVLARAVWLPRWDPLLLSSGAYKYASGLRGPDLEEALTAGRLLYYREGAVATVAVRELTGTTSLSIDGKVDASNAGDMLTQRLLAHVPLLLHPSPKRVAILGLGSGVTLGSALTHPIEQADVLEISPEVVEASRFFDPVNHRAVVDPRTRLVIGDGRTHLLFTNQQYDVIISEPSNPWMAGIASLFTREFFTAAQARLTSDGILCQWAHTYDISTADLQSIVATFLSVFPDGALWLVGDGDILLIGSRRPLDARLAAMADAWQRPGVGEDLALVGAREPFHLLSLVVAQGATLRQWAAASAIQTDNRASLEFSGPQTVFSRAAHDNAELLRQLASTGRPPAVSAAIDSASPDAWRDRGWMLYQADAYRPAYEDFRRALTGNPRDTRALEGLIRSAAPINRQSDARELLTRLAADPANVPAKLTLSRLLAASGAFDEAVRIPLGLLQIDNTNVAALEELASILSDAGDAERMAPVVAKLRATAPASESAHYYSAALLFLQERPDLALAEARAVTSRNPSHAKAQNLAGASLASLGHRDEARAAFQAAIALDPRDPATYTNLATLEMQSGNREAAARYFTEALMLDPESQAARQGLAQARYQVSGVRHQ